MNSRPPARHPRREQRPVSYTTQTDSSNRIARQADRGSSSPRRLTSSHPSRSTADMLNGTSNTRSLAFLMNAAGEDSEEEDDENDLLAAPSPQQRSPSTPEEKQAEKEHLHPSGQCGLLMLNHTPAAAAAGGHRRRRRSSLLPPADLDPLMPGLLTCRDDNMSKLATYSDDDSDDQVLRDWRGNPPGDKNEQPSTGRTVAASEFSNLAGTSAAATVVSPPRKPAAGGDGTGRSLGLVPSYSTAEYAGWSKFCLATSDTENEGSSSGSFEQAKEVRSGGKTGNTNHTAVMLLRNSWRWPGSGKTAVVCKTVGYLTNFVATRACVCESGNSAEVSV